MWTISLPAGVVQTQVRHPAPSQARELGFKPVSGLGHDARSRALTAVVPPSPPLSSVRFAVIVCLGILFTPLFGPLNPLLSPQNPVPLPQALAVSPGSGASVAVVAWRDRFVVFPSPWDDPSCAPIATYDCQQVRAFPPDPGQVAGPLRSGQPCSPHHHVTLLFKPLHVFLAGLPNMKPRSRTLETCLVLE
jgi:hypothetical protein